MMFDLDGFKATTTPSATPPATPSGAPRQRARRRRAAGRAYRLGGDEFCVWSDARPSARGRSPPRPRRPRRWRGFAIALARHRSHPDERATRPKPCGSPTSACTPRRSTDGAPRRQSSDVLLQAPPSATPSSATTCGSPSLARRRPASSGSTARSCATLARRGAARRRQAGDPGRDPPTSPARSTRRSGFMRRHTLIGERILAAAPALLPVAARARDHERFDGTGYPDGLAGEDIPLAARIIAICDAFDAMTTTPPTRGRTRPATEALAELRRCAGHPVRPEAHGALPADLQRGPAARSIRGTRGLAARAAIGPGRLLSPAAPEPRRACRSGDLRSGGVRPGDLRSGGVRPGDLRPGGFASPGRAA